MKKKTIEQILREQRRDDKKAAELERSKSARAAKKVKKAKKETKFGFDALSEEEKEIAKKLGFHMMFAERRSVKEIYDYILMLPEGKEKIVALTGLSMLQNFFACYIAKNYQPKEERGIKS